MNLKNKEPEFIYVKPLIEDKFSFYKIISFDTESYKKDIGDGILENLAIAGFYDGNEFKDAYTTEQILDYIHYFLKKYKQISLVSY